MECNNNDINKYYLLILNCYSCKVNWISLLKKIISNDIRLDSKLTYYIFDNYIEAERYLIKNILKVNNRSAILKISKKGDIDTIELVEDQNSVTKSLLNKLSILDSIFYPTHIHSKLYTEVEKEIKNLNDITKKGISYILNEDKDRDITLEDKINYYNIFKAHFSKKSIRLDHCIFSNTDSNIICIEFNYLELNNLIKNRDLEVIDYIVTDSIPDININNSITDAIITETGTFWATDNDDNIYNGFKVYIQKTLKLKYWLDYIAIIDSNTVIYLLDILINK